MIDLYTKFHVSNSTGPLVIFTTPEYSYRFFAAVIFLSHILWKEKYLNLNCIFSKYQSQFQCPILSGASVSPTSQVRVSATSVLLIIGIKKVWVWGSFQWHNTYTKFLQHPSIGSQAVACGQTRTSCKERTPERFCTRSCFGDHRYFSRRSQ
jgi:hypothetical protein